MLRKLADAILWVMSLPVLLMEKLFDSSKQEKELLDTKTLLNNLSDATIQLMLKKLDDDAYTIGLELAVEAKTTAVDVLSKELNAQVEKNEALQRLCDSLSVSLAESDRSVDILLDMITAANKKAAKKPKKSKT
jgi:hypothetical protein